MAQSELQLAENAPLKLENQKQSNPERIAEWLFKTTGNWRKMMAFLLIFGLTAISITFNILLGIMSGVDSISKMLLPAGYAMLDLAALFLSGYLAIKCVSWFLKLVAFSWFGFLLVLSLWAAASFTLSIDTAAENENIDWAIKQKKLEVSSLNNVESIWIDNVANAEAFKTKHQKTLDSVQTQLDSASTELAAMIDSRVRPNLAIYEIVAPTLGMHPDDLITAVRLAWAAAITLSPLVLTLLFVAEMHENKNTRPRRSVIEWFVEKSGSVSESFLRGRSRAMQKHKNVLENNVSGETTGVFTETQGHRNTENRVQAPETRTPAHVFNFVSEMKKRQEQELAQEHIQSQKVEVLRLQAEARKQAEQLAQELKRVRVLEQKRQSDEDSRRAKDKVEHEKRLREHEYQAQKQETGTFPRNTQKSKKQKRAPKPGTFDENLFARMRHEIGSGAVKNTIRGIMAKYGIGYEKAKRYHSKLQEMGVAV